MPNKEQTNLKNSSEISSKQRADAETEIDQKQRLIDYYITEYTIGFLAEQMDKAEYVIPEYQRTFRWPVRYQSRFIESIILGLPVPFLFFYERQDTGKLEIVDGVQRLSTIQAFLNGTLELDDNLERLPTLAGFHFSDLTESRQRKIKNKSIRGIVLSEKADEEARQDLFNRINTGALAANPAEIRRGSLNGPFINLVKELAKNETFRIIAPVSEESEKEREGEELVTRFFAYSDAYLEDLETYNERPSEFLFDYTTRINLKFVEDKQKSGEYKTRFEMVVRFINENFPYGCRKSKNARTTPRARFESIAIGVFLALNTNPNLSPAPAIIERLMQSDEFLKTVRSDGANVKSKLKARLEFVKNYLLEKTEP